MEGLADKSNRLALKKILKNLNPKLVVNQDTEREEFDIVFIKSSWRSKEIGWFLWNDSSFEIFLLLLSSLVIYN